MAGLDEVVGRMAADPGFAAQVRQRPAEALAGYHLSTLDLREIERLLGAPTGPTLAEVLGVRPPDPGSVPEADGGPSVAE